MKDNSFEGEYYYFPTFSILICRDFYGFFSILGCVLFIIGRLKYGSQYRKLNPEEKDGTLMEYWNHMYDIREGIKRFEKALNANSNTEEEIREFQENITILEKEREDLLQKIEVYREMHGYKRNEIKEEDID